MGDELPSNGPARVGRVAAVDVARGLALVGMGVYHSIWDLAHFGFVGASLPFSPGMRLIADLVAGSFLALVGASLALAHAEGLRARPFARRLMRIVAAAALVTVATFLLDRDEPIYFGVLHCIAAASLIAAPFVGAPPWAALAAGAAALAAPHLVASAAFNPPALVWLGLGTQTPRTLDWRPLLPWAGVALVGLGLARALEPRLAASARARWRPASLVGRALGFAGRHSLVIYLLHQPILFGLAFTAANLTGVAERQARDAYLAACPPACVAQGGDAERCAKACLCVADRAEAAGLTLGLALGENVGEARDRLKSVVEACGREGR